MTIPDPASLPGALTASASGIHTLDDMDDAVAIP
jgi:hypothetical protein